MSPYGRFWAVHGGWGEIVVTGVTETLFTYRYCPCSRHYVR
ncbi:MAG: hypothetical protein JWN00_5445 [Actinomycetia bacterium]|nr:hypothetical protein [Actinomycetes bacterium]